MLAYILGLGNGVIKGLRIRARGITNKGSLSDSKSRQRDFKSGQERLLIGAGITNRRRTAITLKILVEPN